MNKFIKIFIYILVGILQLTLMPIFQIQGMIPNIVLIGTLILAIIDFEEDSLYLAVVGGLVLDLTSPYFFGFYTIFFIALVISIKYLLLKILPGINLPLIIFVTFIVTILFGLLENLFLMRWPNLNILTYATYSTILGAIIFVFLQSIVIRNQVIKL